jgi:site-specific DNA-methyltransferase (adenine-specific)
VKVTSSILCGDNAQLLRKLAANSVQLTVTSPPYDSLRTYKGYSWNFEAVAKELWRVTRPGGVVVWVVGDQTKNGSESGTSFRQALYFKEIGFNLHDTMIYEKNSYMPLTHNRYEQAWEFMFVFSKKSPSVFNPIKVPCATVGSYRNRGGAKHYEASHSERRREEKTPVNAEKYHSNVFVYDVGKNEKTAHNAPFPEALARDHIASWSNPRDLVLDPFIGSGTTGKMAKLLGRNFVGFDISEEYCKLARERIRNAK